MNGRVAKIFKLSKISSGIKVKTILSQETGASFTLFTFGRSQSKLQFAELKIFCNTTLDCNDGEQAILLK